MSDIVQMKVEKRERSGTGSSRDLRAKNYVPGIVYGEKKDPVLISIDEKALKSIFKIQVFSQNNAN